MAFIGHTHRTHFVPALGGGVHRVIRSVIHLGILHGATIDTNGLAILGYDLHLGLGRFAAIVRYR